MYIIEKPLSTILRDYCHVEWWEIEELSNDIYKDDWKDLVPVIKKQFIEAINSSELDIRQLEILTGNDFDSHQEAADWLKEIYNVVFNDKCQ